MCLSTFKVKKLVLSVQGNGSLKKTSATDLPDKYVPKGVNQFLVHSKEI